MPITPNAIAWTATFGLVPGYHHDNNGVGARRTEFVKCWMAHMEEVYEKTGLVVSCVIGEATVLYPESRGCPPSGEMAVLVTGSTNPVFVKPDQIEYFKVVLLSMIDKVREEMDQTTVRLEISEIESHYLVRSE